ncbi:AAA family ATPase [Primorskyibacter sp. 2E107]|uniref:AAA family ATPase n=1 Tax=Primorskyibacter sp. 2E107 TaxID=3403458 RepID=UPI003AF8E0E9
MSDHFFLVAGGPGAGKISLITEPARRGFHTIRESGPAIIREEIARDGDALPSRNRMAYAERILERDPRADSAAQALPGPLFLDRGIPDILGYLTLCSLPEPPHVDAAAKAICYNARVFLAPFWNEIFTQDTERKQTRAEAEASSPSDLEMWVDVELGKLRHDRKANPSPPEP